MPTYEYLCQKGHKFDRYLRLADYDIPQNCECGEKAKRLISAPMIAPMFEDYQSPIDGKPITSKKARINDMARNGCVPYEPSMVEDNNKKLTNEENKLEKQMDDTVDWEISQMPSRKKELLDQELKSGADLDYYRG